MSPFVISILIGIPSGVYIYNKFMQRTGNNVKTSAIAGTVAGFILFVVSLTLVYTVDSFLG